MIIIDPTKPFHYCGLAGEGGYGRCDKITAQSTTGKTVTLILKIIKPENDYEREQILSEAEFSKRLTERYSYHMEDEHIGKPCTDSCHLFGKFVENLTGKAITFDDGSTIPEDSSVLAFKFINGETISKVINSHATLSLDQIKAITIQTLEALIVLEEEGILHLDLKPSNIMVKHLDDIKKLKIQLIDFGLSEESPYQIVRPKQTCFYRHPLVDLTGKFSYEADGWSLGCFLFELITGNKLFRFVDSSVSLDSRRKFLATVSAINGPYPQGWLRKAKTLFPDWIKLNPQDNKYYFTQSLDPSITSQWTMLGKTAKDFYIFDPLYKAAVLKGYNLDEIKILADLTARLVSYKPPSFNESFSIIKGIIKSSSPTDVTELYDAFGCEELMDTEC